MCIRVKLAKDVKNAINELENKAEEKKKKSRTEKPKRWKMGEERGVGK